MTEAASRADVLGGFDAARDEFIEAVRGAPDAALRFKPAGEDYTLGGLVVHVSDVLRHYAHVLDALRQHAFGAFEAPAHLTPAEDADQILNGFGGESRGPVLEAMRSAHMAFLDAVRLLPEEDFTRKAAVTYGGGDPYPTSPADVVGWVADHYREHTQQIGQLIGAWSTATR
jgi:DinB superfamily